MWTKIPQMCFRIHFREQNCKTALVEKIPKEPVTFFSVSFPPSIRSYTLLPPPSLPRILASSSLSLFMIHPEQEEGTGGISDYYSQLPNLCFQLLSKHLCCLIPLFCQSARKAIPQCIFAFPKFNISAV